MVVKICCLHVTVAIIKWPLQVTTAMNRVRMILALGYWVLGNICRCSIVLLLGDIFPLWHPVRYRSDSSRHHPHDNHLDICGVGEWGGVEYKLYIIIIQLWDFTWYSVVYILLQNQYIATLHSSIGISIGYWYHKRPILLDTGCLVWYRSNPSHE